MSQTLLWVPSLPAWSPLSGVGVLRNTFLPVGSRQLHLARYSCQKYQSHFSYFLLYLIYSTHQHITSLMPSKCIQSLITSLQGTASTSCSPGQSWHPLPWHCAFSGPFADYTTPPPVHAPYFLLLFDCHGAVVMVYIPYYLLMSFAYCLASPFEYQLQGTRDFLADSLYF
jgi:hypothetical protein